MIMYERNGAKGTEDLFSKRNRRCLQVINREKGK